MLWASEGAIYGRFGYGIARRAARARSRAGRPRGWRPRPRSASRCAPAGRPSTSRRCAPCTSACARAGRGCSTARARGGTSRLNDPERERHGAQPLQAVIVRDGYALYAVRPDCDEDGPAGEVRVRELVAATPAAHARLWAFLLDQDLTRTITWAWRRPTSRCG